MQCTHKELNTLMWQTDAQEKRERGGARRYREQLLSTLSWTLSARLEPDRLVGSPNYRVSHPGHVTPNPPWACLSLARPQCCCCLPRQASWLLLPQTQSYWSYQREKWSEAGPTKTHIGWTSCTPRTPHVTLSRLNWEREKWRERDGEGGSYNLFSVCDCISVRVILFFTHVTQTESWSPLGQS